MFFLPLGLMYGSPSTVRRLWFNQSAAVPGNLVGGVVAIGLTAHLMNHWKSPLFPAHDGRKGTYLAHDVESTRRARDPCMPASTERLLAPHLGNTSDHDGPAPTSSPSNPSTTGDGSDARAGEKAGEKHEQKNGLVSFVLRGRRRSADARDEMV